MMKIMKKMSAKHYSVLIIYAIGCRPVITHNIV